MKIQGTSTQLVVDPYCLFQVIYFVLLITQYVSSVKKDHHFDAVEPVVAGATLESCYQRPEGKRSSQSPAICILLFS